ncbi:MAG: hypothetical protein HC892_01445 [Saprospiraceae bacterium]|nr:hypothetical protein [Saprospiraceae bacterium]
MRVLSSEYPNVNLGTDLYDVLSVYNRALSDTEIKSYHNSFASRVVFKEDFKDAIVGQIPDVWKIVSGTFVINEDSQGKYLKCTSNGSIYYPLKDTNKTYTKLNNGNMTLSKSVSKVTLTATSGQIIRELILTQAKEV